MSYIDLRIKHIKEEIRKNDSEDLELDLILSKELQDLLELKKGKKSKSKTKIEYDSIPEEDEETEIVLDESTTNDDDYEDVVFDDDEEISLFESDFEKNRKKAKKK